MSMLLELRNSSLSQISEDPWLTPDGNAMVPGSGTDRRTVKLEDFDPARDHGLWLGIDAEPEVALSAVELIALEFPAFNDGRGLSLAVLLRSRYGYTGELRAVGETHPDLLHYMQRCGIDTVLLPEPHDFASAQAAFNPYSDYYQASVSNPEPAFRRLRRGA
ncbi:MAG: DUF934 domain-containing protein [Pseudomonadales bacterium]